jgi:hypothetical protein
MSRGIPGYPGGLPRGSAREAGPVPPRPLPRFGTVLRFQQMEISSFPRLHNGGSCCN